ncbi:hypothetical protein GB937_006770 [Aspergillus fischeri]|nr:hypothetical protein GB937_006770 [Aspergillus fischeri]
MDLDRRMTIAYVIENMSGRETPGNGDTEAYVREIDRLRAALSNDAASARGVSEWCRQALSG